MTPEEKEKTIAFLREVIRVIEKSSRKPQSQDQIRRVEADIARLEAQVTQEM